MLILVSRDFRMNGPNLPVNTNLTSSAAAVYRTITNKDLEQTCQSLVVTCQKKMKGMKGTAISAAVDGLCSQAK